VEDPQHHLCIPALACLAWGVHGPQKVGVVGVRVAVWIRVPEPVGPDRQGWHILCVLVVSPKSMAMTFALDAGDTEREA
jgi:hypothetical protein